MGSPTDTPDVTPVTAQVLDGATIAATNAATGVLANDSDPEGGALTVSAVDGSAANVGVALNGLYGQLILNANGAYTYTADNAGAVAA